MCFQPQLTRFFQPSYSRQPWSAYAVHLTTLSPPALLGDLLLVWLCHKASVGWGEVSHDRAMTSLYLWMFTSKWIKLLGHYIRYPVDVFLLPVSVLFGYFHGAIKMYAVMTLNVVSVYYFLPFILTCILSKIWRVYLGISWTILFLVALRVDGGGRS